MSVSIRPCLFIHVYLYFWFFVCIHCLLYSICIVNSHTGVCYSVRLCLSLYSSCLVHACLSVHVQVSACLSIYLSVCCVSPCVLVCILVYSVSACQSLPVCLSVPSCLCVSPCQSTCECQPLPVALTNRHWVHGVRNLVQVAIELCSPHCKERLS